MSANELHLDAPIKKPEHENPARPIESWACARNEVSGLRLWGLFAQRFGAAESFFAEHFVANYCPLAFFAGARNLTPDKLPPKEAAPLFAACDAHLAKVVRASGAEWVIGIGGFAEARAPRAGGGSGHPFRAHPASQPGLARRQSRLGGTGDEADAGTRPVGLET